MHVAFVNVKQQNPWHQIVAGSACLTRCCMYAGDNGDNLKEWPPLQALEQHRNNGTKLSQVQDSSDILA